MNKMFDYSDLNNIVLISSGFNSLHVLVEYRAIVFAQVSSGWIMVRDERNIYSSVKLITCSHSPGHGRAVLYKVLARLESTERVRNIR